MSYYCLRFIRKVKQLRVYMHASIAVNINRHATRKRCETVCMHTEHEKRGRWRENRRGVIQAEVKTRTINVSSKTRTIKFSPCHIEYLDANWMTEH